MIKHADWCPVARPTRTKPPCPCTCGVTRKEQAARNWVAAHKAHSRAFLAYCAAREDYRARSIGDAEFLAVREAYHMVLAIFDAIEAEYVATHSTLP